MLLVAIGSIGIQSASAQQANPPVKWDQGYPDLGALNQGMQKAPLTIFGTFAPNDPTIGTAQSGLFVYVPQAGGTLTSQSVELLNSKFGALNAAGTAAAPVKYWISKGKWNAYVIVEYKKTDPVTLMVTTTYSQTATYAFEVK